MRRRSDAANDAAARGAEKIAFQLDGREILCAGRQVGNAAVTARGIRERNDCRRMEVPVGREQLVAELELAADATLGDLGKPDADQAWKTAFAPVEEFIQRSFRAQCHDRCSKLGIVRNAKTEFIASSRPSP